MQSDKCTTGTVVDSDEGDMVSEKSLINSMYNIKCLAISYVHYTYFIRAAIVRLKNAKK